MYLALSKGSRGQVIKVEKKFPGAKFQEGLMYEELEELNS